MLAILRSNGIPARYVSGYIEAFDPDSGEALTGAAASHAWVEVYLPGGLGGASIRPITKLRANGISWWPWGAITMTWLRCGVRIEEPSNQSMNVAVFLKRKAAVEMS